MKPIIETCDWGHYRYALADKELDRNTKRLRFQFPDGQVLEKDIIWKEEVEYSPDHGHVYEATSSRPYIECYPFKIKALVSIAGLLAERIKENK